MKKKAVESAKKYESLPMRDKIGMIAQAFDCSSGKIVLSPCFRDWSGTSDISIQFDNGASLFLGNCLTPQAKTAQVQNEYVNAALLRYNPEIVAATKETALAALREREVVDNAIAAQRGLKPYTLLNVELNSGVDDRSSLYIGWYYVTVAVDGKIHAHMESGLNYDIAHGEVKEVSARDQYYTAGGLKESDVDYVFHNIGFSSTVESYSLPIADDVLRRAEKTLAERSKTQAVTKQDTCRKEVRDIATKAHRPSIKAQLAVKPVPGDKPATKSKERGVR